MNDASTHTWWGWLADYDTGETIRAATEEEWHRTDDKLNGHDSDAYSDEGAWTDENGRVVYVDGGPDSSEEW